MFLYTVIVPVIPFALESRANIEPGQGESGPSSSLPDPHINVFVVQSWVSILIAVYGGALAAFSRESKDTKSTSTTSKP